MYLLSTSYACSGELYFDNKLITVDPGKREDWGLHTKCLYCVSRYGSLHVFCLMEDEWGYMYSQS